MKEQKTDYYPTKPRREDPEFFVPNGEEVKFGGRYEPLGHFSERLYEAALLRYEDDCKAWRTRQFVKEQALRIEVAKEAIALNNQIISDAEKAIIATSEFKKGDKVKIKEPGIKLNDPPFFTTVFINHVGCHDNGEIFYNFNKMKDDGTESKHRYYIEDKVLWIKKLS